MKTARDPRHLKRIHLMQQLFSYSSNSKTKLDPATKEIVEHLGEIDQKITEAAPTWPINQINKIDLAILRLSFFEIMIEDKAPKKVVVDEAVELAKEYGSDSSPSFVNGVLGKLLGK